MRPGKADLLQIQEETEGQYLHFHYDHPKASQHPEPLTWVGENNAEPGKRHQGSSGP